jgi:DNA-binding transcriptional ArsR family regulator
MAESATADEVFRALSDPTRRRVLERLARGPASVSELARPFDMKLPSFVQHLAMLEQSHLVTSVKKGRVRVFEINSQRLKVAEDWLAQQRRLWETRLDQLDEYLLKLTQQEEQR